MKDYSVVNSSLTENLSLPQGKFFFQAEIRFQKNMIVVDKIGR